MRGHKNIETVTTRKHVGAMDEGDSTAAEVNTKS